MPEKETRPTLPTDPHTGDYVHAIFKGGISSIPIVGGAASELFGLVIAPSLARRRDQWLTDLETSLRALEGRIEGFSIENLVANETFVSAVLNATQVALRTHDVRKREALRNAVLNVALGRTDESERDAAFWTLVDRFTPLHLEVLAFFHAPWDAIERNGKKPHKELFQQPLYLLLLEVIDGLKERLAAPEDHAGALNQIFELVIKDLSGAGLVGVNSHVEKPPSWKRWTTHLGDYFMDFITKPVEARGE